MTRKFVATIAVLVAAALVLLLECAIRFAARACKKGPERAPVAQFPQGHVLARQQGCMHVACYAVGQPWRRAELRHTTSPIILLVHGLGADISQFDFGPDGGLVAALVAAGFGVVAPDLWGHGSTDGPDIAYSPEDFLDQLEQCVTWAIGSSRRLHVLGFSHGAFLALVYSAANSRRIVSLCLTAPYACDLATEIPLPGGPVLATIYLLLSRRRALQAGIRALVRTFSSLRPELLSPAAREIRRARTPVLMLVGARDFSPGMRIVSHAVRLQALLPKARLRVFPRCGHSSFFFGCQSLKSQYRHEVVRFLVGVLRDQVQDYHCSGESLQAVPSMTKASFSLVAAARVPRPAQASFSPAAAARVQRP